MHNARPRGVDMESLYERYQRLAKVLPGRFRWLSLIFAPAGTSLVVLISGLLTIAAGLTVTVIIGQITSKGGVSVGVAWLLSGAFLAESIGYVVKERQELILMVAVRQLVYRRFRRLFTKSFSSSGAKKKVLTYPGQITEFVHVLDAVISIVQFIAFLAISLHLYGPAGALAIFLIAGLAVISVRLIILVGRLWEKYISLEGERRGWIQRVADALPRGRFIPSWDSALNAITGIRRTEEGLLRKRVRLQVLNGFIDRSALTVILSLVAILGVWIRPDTTFSVGIILAARYLYAAVQNILVDYRVIRLAIPMMHDLDSLESLHGSAVKHDDLLEHPVQKVEVLDSLSDQAEVLRSSTASPGLAFVPRNPQVPQAVLSAWRSSVTTEELAHFAFLASQMRLSNDAIERFWKDITTLSSGEIHRAVVALILTESPDWLILDDTFASLDPATRDLVASIIFTNVPKCTILTSSSEYVPTLLSHHLDIDIPIQTSPIQDFNLDNSNMEEDDSEWNIPDPSPRRATFLRSVRLLFGWHVVWVVLGGILLAGSEVVFALTISESDALSMDAVYFVGVCGLGAILGAVMFFYPIYRVPIARLSKLHGRVIRRLEKFANPRNSGAIVARMGEDFSDLQMSIPGSLGSVFIVIIQTLMLVAGSVAGAPLFLIVVLAVSPLALIAMRQGSKWIMPAATAAANQRGEFLGVIGSQASVHAIPVSTRLSRVGDLAFARTEASYMAATVQKVNAYALRSILIQALTLLVNISAVFLVAVLGNSTPLVAPATVIFFAVTLASGIQSTVETLQEVGVLGLTTERVRLLEDFQADRTYPPVRTLDFERLKNVIDSGELSVALIGATGAGKSVMLDALCRQLPDGEVAVIPEVDPFAAEAIDLSGLALARSEIRSGIARLVLLDETMKTLTPEMERVELTSLTDMLERYQKQAVVVLHSRSNLDRFPVVIDLDGQQGA